MLFKRLLGMESERERQESDAWLREHPQGRRWLDSMEGGREYLRRREFLGSLDTEQVLRSVMRGRREMLRKRRERWIAAASVCLIVGAGVFCLLSRGAGSIIKVSESTVGVPRAERKAL